MSKAEEMLAIERNLLRTLIDAVPDYLYVKDRAGRFTLANAALVHSVGYDDTARVIGQTDFDVHSPSAAQAFRAAELSVIETGEPVINLEERFVDAKGEPRWVLTTKVPLRDAQGEIVGLVGVGRDITERKLATDHAGVQRDLALRLAESRSLDQVLPWCLDAAVHMAGLDCGGIYLVNTEGNLELAHAQGVADEAACDLRHLPAGQQAAVMALAGWPGYTSVNRDMLLAYPALEREGLRAVGVVPIVDEDRVVACFVLASHTLEDVPAGGRSAVESIAAQVGNIISRLQAERALHASEERYRTLVENSPDAIALVDGDGRVVTANRQAVRMFGYQAEAIDESLSVYKMIGEQDRLRAKQDLARVLQGGVLRESCYQAVRYDGSIFSLEITGVLIPDRVPRLMVIGRDISDRQHAEAERSLLFERERQRRRLAEALRKAGAALSGTLDFDGVLDRILEEIRWIVPYDSASVMTIDANTGMARVARERGYDRIGPEVRRAVTGREFDIATTANLQTIVRTRQPLLITDTHAYPGWLAIPEVSHIRSWIGAPIIVDNRVIAIFSLDKCEPGFYQSDHLAYLAPFVVQASLATQNARLHAETVKALERERRLNVLTRRISDASNLRRLFEELPRLVAEVLEGDSCVVWLLDASSAARDDRYWYNTDVKALRDWTEGAGAEALRKVIETLEPKWVARAGGWPDAESSIGPPGVQSAVWVPIVSDQGRLGALAVFSVDPARQFNQRDLELAETIGRQTGGAIQRARLFEEVKTMAITDSVTGLFNRGHFLDLAAHEMARVRDAGGRIAVMMLDIDHFKPINDMHGHIAGDQVLWAIAECCRRNLRITDVVARYGGDEFAILLPETSLADARRTAERLRSAIAQLKIKPIQGTHAGQSPGVKTYAVTVSVGLSVCAGAPYLDFETLLAQADQSLYAAKQSGRNRVSAWEG